MHILKNKEGKYLRFVDAEFSNGIFWSDKTSEHTVDFDTEAKAQKFLKEWGFNSDIEIIYLGEGKPILPKEYLNMDFDFYYSQASKHLRQADMKGPEGSAITERGLDSAIMHAEFAVAFLKMAKSNLQGELF